jgi:hypothetical protein
MSAGTYTRLGKWYSVAYLGLLASVFGIGAIIGIFAGDGFLALSMLWLTLPFTVLLVVTIVGILRAKRWAKWIAIAVYGFFIFNGIQSLIISISVLSAFKLFNSTTTLLFRSMYVVAIVLSSLGIVLLLQKPRRDRLNEQDCL